MDKKEVYCLNHSKCKGRCKAGESMKKERIQCVYLSTTLVIGTPWRVVKLESTLEALKESSHYISVPLHGVGKEMSTIRVNRNKCLECDSGSHKARFFFCFVTWNGNLKVKIV